jgi:hypothetical protein
MDWESTEYVIPCPVLGLFSPPCGEYIYHPDPQKPSGL